ARRSTDNPASARPRSFADRAASPASKVSARKPPPVSVRSASSKGQASCRASCGSVPAPPGPSTTQTAAASDPASYRGSSVARAAPPKPSESRCPCARNPGVHLAAPPRLHRDAARPTGSPPDGERRRAPPLRPASCPRATPDRPRAREEPLGRLALSCESLSVPCPAIAWIRYNVMYNIVILVI